MADKQRFPQIPGTVWWGVRSILKKSPRVVINEQLLGAELDVQSAAAKQYLSELRAVHIIDKDGRATELANRWRLDDSYAEAVSEILASSYPEGLIHLAPADEGNRRKAVAWFERAGLGKGAAGNKAAAYFMIGSPVPNESAATMSSEKAVATRKATAGKSVEKSKQVAPVARATQKRQSENGQLPLNINVQIHISADAGTDQIESIFSAMRRYLYDSEAS